MAYLIPIDHVVQTASALRDEAERRLLENAKAAEAGTDGITDIGSGKVGIVLARNSLVRVTQCFCDDR